MVSWLWWPLQRKVEGKRQGDGGGADGPAVRVGRTTGPWGKNQGMQDLDLEDLGCLLMRQKAGARRAGTVGDHGRLGASGAGTAVEQKDPTGQRWQSGGVLRGQGRGAVTERQCNGGGEKIAKRSGHR